MLQLRRQHMKELVDALSKSSRAREEGKRALAECEGNVVKFFEGNRSMEPHERGSAARALLVGPSRALKNLMHEADALEVSAKTMHQEMTIEGMRLRDAGNEGMLQLNNQLDASVRCLTNEMQQAESDSTFSISALLETIEAERRANMAAAKELEQTLDEALREKRQLKQTLDDAELRAQQLSSELSTLRAIHVQDQMEHEALVDNLKREQRDRAAETQRQHEAALAQKQGRIERLEAQRAQAEQDGAATRVSMAMRLRNLAQEKARQEQRAAEEHEELRAGQQALTREMEVASEEARERMEKLEEGKREEASKMKMKLDKLKKLQEEAVTGVQSRVERKSRSRLAHSNSASSTGGSSSSPTKAARPRQLLYWEVLKSKMEQSPPRVRKALVSTAIERERGLLNKYGEELDKERAAMASA